MSDSPVFPPLLNGAQAEDPFAQACAEARQGCDAGLVLYNLGPSVLQAAIVFAPEVPLAQAMAMLPLCAVGFQNALGALAPPEVGVHLAWNGDLRLNGAICGQMRAAASDTDPHHVPDWLVVSFHVKLLPQSDTPGETPDVTTLYGEGCAEVSPVELLEAWARHMLVALNRWDDEGAGPLHKEWTGLAWAMGDQITYGDLTGDFTGIDENFGLLLKTDTTTHLIPLTDLLEPAP
ncbi:biotin/lipoate--protein ligase family protein [Sulfitobacter pontiacus]|jgi:BirA family biotin operon repressor/biotin-[acetyl-CoA-carboxylase] ligase|uniref:biotin/lipoate--protein ligase family protein n=1 Tax=Sulfitobacter pontiacus TaxID=60137 RepID=UPI0030EC13EF